VKNQELWPERGRRDGLFTEGVALKRGGVRNFMLSDLDHEVFLAADDICVGLQSSRILLALLSHQFT